MRLLTYLLFLLVLSSSSIAAAQTTGSFDTTIRFMDTTRLLSCYVPTKYNDTNKYRLMVCLHGLGDNAANYRNALVQSLAWPTHFPNTIFVCPEASATTDDYYQYTGDETIVDSCMKFAMSRYHIDSSDVILQGFSLGGRAALRYGLDNYSKFKALLLNTPAIQGVKNALNGQPTYLYTYANAPHIPIYITHGEQDIFYEPPIDSALKLLILNNGMVRYNDVAGIGHTIPNFSKMADALQFFDTPAHAGNDVNLFELDAPLRIITGSLPSSALIQNVGSNPVSSVSFLMLQGSTYREYVWDSTLPPFGHALVQLPIIPVQSGTLENALTVQIENINTLVDTLSADNEKVDTFQFFSQGDQLPLSEGFEEDTVFPPPGWQLQLAGDVFSPWFQDTVRKSGNYSAGAFNSIFFFDNTGRAEGLLSPVVDLTSAASPQLSFDLAYNYTRYTPPYFTGTVNLTDTLDVLISTDGGATYTSLLRKSGADLATFRTPTLNPLSYSAVIIQPMDTNWKHYTVDLTPYSTAKQAFVKFNYISGLGGSIYIDNVTMSGPLGVQTPKAISYAVYPNPAADRVTISGDVNSPVDVSILDVAGREVLSQAGVTDGSGKLSLDTHALLPGIYLAHIKIGRQTSTVKLAIER